MEPSTDTAKPRYRYTEAAALAQIRKWKRLMRNCRPERTIPPEMLATGNNSPPVLLYGWPFKDDYLVEYAKHHRLSFEPTPKHREWLGCTTPEFNFADEHYQLLAHHGSHGRCPQAYTCDWAEARAVNECLPEGKKTELKWWWSWDDNDVLSSSIDLPPEEEARSSLAPVACRSTPGGSISRLRPLVGSQCGGDPSPLPILALVSSSEPGGQPDAQIRFLQV
ncbi:hypothetical protein LXA43DRAFT_1060555 [Ganoderma leucocontextum]|nr:hypothetical protein LXA43DRAFT_1060555 [Ganoderma leucocontextum]